MKRVRANDPIALCEAGKMCYKKGDCGLTLECLTKAAELGNINSHYILSVLYRGGKGAKKDLKKEVYHLEIAAIGGHHMARYDLGCQEKNAGKIDRAMKHFIIAAKLGFDDALEMVKKGFMDGLVSKEDYAAALRGHQAAVDATKSQQRDEGEAFYSLSPEEQERRWLNLWGTELL